MATIAELKVKIGANVTDFDKKLSGIQSKMKATGKKMQSMGKSMTIGITAPLGLLGIAAIKSAADLETMEVAFQSLLGSGEAASKMVKDLSDFTAKTPFQLEGVGKAAKQLISFGVQGDKVMDKLKFLGDIAAGANIPLSDMASIFGKSKAKGKAMTEELLQLSDRGVPIIDTLASKMGVAKEAIFDMAAKGEISFDKLQNALISLTEEGGVFANQMEKQSNTLAGIWSTLTDNVGLALAEIGESIIEAFDLKDVLKNAIEWIQGMAESFKQLSPQTKKAIVLVAALVAAIGPLMVALGFLTSTILPALMTGFGVLLGPIGLTIAAIAALGFAAKAVYDHLNRVQTAQEALNETMDNAKKSVAGELGELKKLVIVAKNEKLSRDQRQKAIDELQKKYPNYLKNLQLENINSQETAGAVNKLAVALIRRAQARAIEAKMEEVAARQAEAKLTNGESELTMVDKGIALLKIGTGWSSMAEAATDLHGKAQERLAETTEATNDQLELLVGQLAEITAEEHAVIGPTTDLADAIKEVGTAVSEAGLTGDSAFMMMLQQMDQWEKPILDLKDAFKQADAEAKIFGTTAGDVLTSKIDMTKSAISGAIEKFGEESDVVKKLIGILKNLGTVSEETTMTMMDHLQKAIEMAGALINGVTNIMAQSFKNQEILLENRYNKEMQLIEQSGKSAKQIEKDKAKAEEKFSKQRRKIAVKKAKADKATALMNAIVSTAAAIVGQLAAMPVGPWNIPLAAAMGALGAAQIATIAAQPIPSFAQGGIVSAPMIAQIGDAPSGPEVVAPLSKLQAMLTGGMGDLKTIIRGEDLILVTDRAKANRGFIQ